MIEVSINNCQSILHLDTKKIDRAVREVFQREGVNSAELSLAVVDDQTIHAMNRQYLQHDYATDVLSFVLSETDDRLEGEVVVSAEHAIERAGDFGWSADDELLLYVIHGVLHLVGYRDKTPEEIDSMREREDFYLGKYASMPPSRIEGDAPSRRRETLA